MEPINDVAQISVNDTADALIAGDIVLIDVREPGEWAEGHVDGAVHIPLGQMRTDSVPTDKTVVLMCRSGGRSQSAAEALRESGIETKNMAGGILAWEAAGLETKQD